MRVFDVFKKKNPLEERMELEKKLREKESRAAVINEEIELRKRIMKAERAETELTSIKRQQMKNKFDKFSKRASHEVDSFAKALGIGNKKKR